MEQNRSRQEVTMVALVELANSQLRILTFTGGFSHGESKKIPCLDSQLLGGHSRGTKDMV